MRKIFLPFAAALMLLVFAGCAPKVVFPPVTAPATGSLLPGKFVWFDLFTENPAVSAEFYHTLFGWQFQPTGDKADRVKTVSSEGVPIANLIAREGWTGKAKWLSYLSVRDVETSLARVKELGGTVHREARVLPDRGKVAIAVSPQNASFGLITSSTGDPADVGPVVNRWLGSELWAKDEGASAKFFSLLAGYSVKRVKVRGKATYTMLFSQGHRRGGIVEFPWSGGVPEWVPFIAVANAREVADKAAKMGARLLLAPDMRVKEGRVAIIEDPDGAVFGIQQVD